jgi:hypothetical protein
MQVGSLRAEQLAITNNQATCVVTGFIRGTTLDRELLEWGLCLSTTHSHRPIEELIPSAGRTPANRSDADDPVSVAHELERVQLRPP